jgi:hypothetical protein
VETVVRVGCRSVKLSYRYVAELRYHLVGFLNRSGSGEPV